MPGLFTAGVYTFTPAAVTVPAAGTVTLAQLVEQLQGMTGIDFYVNFTYGSGGTTIDFFLQTSFDQGASWVDIAALRVATATIKKLTTLRAVSSNNVTVTDGTLANNTSNAGPMGDRLRVKYVVAGTYAASSFEAWVAVK